MSTPVEQIKERLSIEDVVGSYVKLERAGKSLKAKCPFHNEKTPSFYVSPDRGGYYCFGCGAKGDIFSFVEQFEGLDFMGALKLLAERSGVDISRGRDGKSDVGYAESKSEKDRLYAVMEEAAVFFETALLGGMDGLPKNPVIERNTSYSMAGAEARDYVKKRGISEKTAREFRIGFIPAEWRLLHTHLRGKGFSDAEIEKAGLAKRPESADGQTAPKSLYDRFRDRVLFPIFDSSGRVIAFSGRILHDDARKSSGKNGGNNAIVAAKYLNSPDTPLYNKSTVLYGIDKAKQAIRERGYSILVEGQMDLVLSHQAGIKNTVAVSGTALADTLTKVDASGAPNIVNNLGIVRRLSPNLILAFDSDAAGRKAAMRSAEIALSLGMDVKIADLPEGADPADLVLADPESWKNVLRHAKPVVEFQLDRVIAEAAAKKLDARRIGPLLRERVYPFIAMLASQTDQGHYVKMVRERALGNAENEGIIWEDIQKIRQQNSQNALKNQSTGSHAAAIRQTGQTVPQGATLSANAELSRLDIISRKLFGLLAYLEKNPVESIDVAGAHAAIRNIAGDERYHNLIQRTETSKDELIFEAELFLGSVNDTKIIRKNLDELMLNFEEDILRRDFATAMAELAGLERKKDGANTAALLQKCQTLSLRIAEIAKIRSNF